MHDSERKKRRAEISPRQLDATPSCDPSETAQRSEQPRTHLLSGGGESTSLAALVDGVADPVDAGIATDSLVGGVDEDDLEVLVDTILVDPVRVEDTESSATTGNTLLGGRAERTLELEVVDSLVGGLSEGGS